MAGNIKGITIEFRGDTSKLDKSLREINNATRKLDRELKNVDKALKFNPTNVELWRQKQELLKAKIAQTTKALDTLRQKQAAMDAKGVDKNSEEYRKLQREIIETESKLKTFNAQLRQVGNVKLHALGEQFQQAGAKIESAGQKMLGVSAAAGVVTASIGVLAYKAGQAADELNTLSKITGIGTEDLQKYGVAANLVDVSTETIAKSNNKLKKSMYSAMDGTGAQAEAFSKLGVSVTNADGSLRDSDEVFQDVISALGTMTNETERDALAQQLMGKSAADLNPLIEDGGETYKEVADTLAKYDLEFVDQETLDGANEFNDLLDTMKVIGTVALQTIGSQLAAYLAPALEKVVGWIGKLANWLSKLSPQTLAMIGTVAAVVAGLAPLLITIGKISTGVGALIKVFGMISGPVGIVILVIGALIAAGVLLYKNWDKIKESAIAFKDKVVKTFNEFKNKVTTTFTNIKTSITNAIQTMISNVVSKVQAFKTKITTTFNNIKTAIITPIRNAIDTVKGIIDKIKGWFPISIGKIFSNLKLPHFSLDWATKEFGKLGSIKYPTGLNVSWYKNGGIFDSPSIVGLAENGSEAVVPLDKLWDKLDNIANASGGIVVNVYGSDNMSVNELAAAVEQRLIQMQKRRTMVWQ